MRLPLLCALILPLAACSGNYVKIGDVSGAHTPSAKIDSVHGHLLTGSVRFEAATGPAVEIAAEVRIVEHRKLG